MAHGHAVQLALLFAATHPERPTRLCSSTASPGSAQRRLSGGDAAEGAGFRAPGIETQWGTGTLAMVLAPSVAGQPGVKDWYGRVERYAASPGTALAKMRAIFELDVRNVFPLVAAPTLVVHNRDDWFIRAGTGATWPSTSPAHACSSATAPDHWPIGDGISSARSRSSSSALADDRPMSTASWRRSSSWTWRLDRAVESRSAIAAGSALSDVSRRPSVGPWATYRGELVNTAGDGLLATFDGPARAIRSAAEFRDSLGRPASRCAAASTPAR